jgi:HPt (histidine-containing phosphotransfer) domain-containing protein
MDTSAHPSDNSDAPLIDRAILLDRVDGDEDLLREITSIFLEEYPELLREIQEGMTAGDANRVERASHSLKGSVSNFGAHAATQAAYRLEAIARKGSMEEAPAAYADLVSQLQLLQPALKQLGE